MADLNGMYDENAALPSDRDPFPAGVYPIQVIESDVGPTKNGKGTILKFKAEVIDGEHKGRLVFGQMNLQNENATAMEIGQSEFRALREVTGVLAPDDTQDLHFKQFQAHIEIEPAKGEFKAKNQIHWRKTVKLLEDGAPAGSPPAGKGEVKSEPAKTESKPAAGAARRPWKKAA